MARDKWWRRQDHHDRGDRGRYTPHLWRVWLVAPIWVTVASVLAWVIYLRLRAVAVPRAASNGGPASLDPLEVIKTTITVAGFVGAVLVGVYGYRKQRLVEGDARRADAEQLAQRYTTAADQLGHEKPAVRLAGVYAMARLADDWDDQRQVCIDVLCAYLRMPYETDPASEKHREGEREVRLTIIRLIRDHLRDPSVPNTWCGRDLDFRNATFDGGDFDGVKFTGGTVIFSRAKFTTGYAVHFSGAEFAGGLVTFDQAEFAGGVVFLSGTKFTGGVVPFDAAEFTGGAVVFSGAEFTGGRLSFVEAEFIGSKIVFYYAKFTGSEVSFDEAKFTGGEISFGEAKFTGGKVSFENAEFTAHGERRMQAGLGDETQRGLGVTVLGRLMNQLSRLRGGTVSSFGTEHAPGCSITWGPFEPPVAWTALQERERRQNEPPL
jgi:uncharacterized protein YjbI with pentapeptide repeats